MIITFFSCIGPTRENMKGESSMIVALLTKTDAFKYFNYRERAKRKRSNMKQAKILQRSEERE